MDDSDQSVHHRRNVLRALVTGAVGLASGCQTRPDSPTKTESEQTPSGTDSPVVDDYVTHDIPFGRAVDAVDVGADATGESDVAPAVEPHMQEGTLLVFPPGRYLIETPITVPNHRVGIVADGDVTFELSPELSDSFLIVDGVDAFLFRGIDIDLRGQPNSGMHVHSPTKFHVENVRYVGRGGLTGIAFALAVTKPRGTGYLRNVSVPHGGHPDQYNQPDGAGGDGRIGVWSGLNHRGRLRVVDSEFSEFGNNGLYTSRTPGDVQVVDSYFENNNASSIRISGAGSYVERCHVVVDFRLYDGPKLTSTDSGFNPRGIMVDDGAATNELPRREPGAEIRDSRVEISQIPPGTYVQGAILQNPAARSMLVSDTTISVDVDGTPGVGRGWPGADGWVWRPRRNTPPKPHWTRLRKTTITGTASGGSAINLEGADDSRIENCYVDQPGAGRNGLTIRNTTDVIVDGGEYRASGFPLVVVNSQRGNEEGCRLRFVEPPRLDMNGRPDSLVRFGSLETGGETDGDGTCVLDGANEQLGDDTWKLRAVTIDGGELLGTALSD